MTAAARQFATRPGVRRLAALPLLALLALPLPACTSMSPLGGSGNDATAAELREIKQRLVEIQRQATITRVEMEELRRRVETLESAAGVRPPATGTPARSAPRRDVPAARDAGPTVRRTPPSDPAENREPRPLTDPGFEESDLQVERPVPAEVTGTAGGSGMTASPAPDDAEPAPVSAEGQTLYDRGYTFYHQGRYLDAEASFQRFLQSFADTDLGDNAQYWIGEARYARRDFAGALAAFREVVSRYPRGNKVPDALLKAGQSLEELGDAESARDSYREVIDRFPGSAASAVAEERLSSLP